MDTIVSAGQMVMELLREPFKQESVRNFYNGYHETYVSNRELMFYLTPDEICAGGARMALISDAETGEFIAGARGVPSERQVHIGQCFTRPLYKGRGLVGAVIAGVRLSFLEDPDQHAGPLTDAVLDVRVEKGMPAPAPHRAYRKCGFADVRIERRSIPDDPAVRHLRDSADPDGTYSTLIMEADASSLKMCAEAVRDFTIKN